MKERRKVLTLNKDRLSQPNWANGSAHLPD